MKYNKEGQQKFLEFILERVKEEQKEAAQALLMANFKKQAEGTFSQEDIKAFISQMMSMLRPECIEEVQRVARQFASKGQE